MSRIDDRLRDQAELVEAVGDALLGRDDVVGDGADHEVRAVGRDGLDVQRDAGDCGERFGDLVAVLFGPFAGRGRHVDDLLQDGAVVLRELAVGDVEGIGLGDFARIDQDAAALLGLTDREIGIPDRPGLDAAIGEGGTGIGRRQIDRGDVGIGEAGLLQRLHHDIVGAGPLGETDTLALQIGDRADRRILRHQDALAVGDGLARGIDDRRSGGLGEHRRGIADRAEVDTADVHRLHHRRARGELDPFHVDALRIEMLFQGGLLARDNQHAGLLVADTNFLHRALRVRSARQVQRRPRFQRRA